MKGLGKRETPLLEIKKLTVAYQNYKSSVDILKDFSLSLEKNQVLGIVGESGSGKTTLVRSLLGLLPAGGEIKRGKILFKGTDLLKLGQEEQRTLRGRQISMIFQDPSAALNPIRRIGTQFTETLCCHLGISKNIARILALEMLAKMCLPDPAKILSYYPFQLSGGMKQRVTIAMAMALNPEILIADEPTSALDVTVQAQIIKEMEKLRQNFATSIILITHNIGLVAYLADKIGVMYGGRLVEWGTKEQVLNQPGHPYTKALLEASPQLADSRKLLKAIKGLPPSFLDLPRGCPFALRCEAAYDFCLDENPENYQLTKGHLVACYQADYASYQDSRSKPREEVII